MRRGALPKYDSHHERGQYPFLPARDPHRHSGPRRVSFRGFSGLGGSSASRALTPSPPGSRVHEIEACIRQLEIEKRFVVSSVGTFGASHDAERTLHAADDPALASGSSCSGQLSEALSCQLSIVDFSPEWDSVQGGSKMLLTAETVAGCHYAVLFGGTSAPTEVIRRVGCRWVAESPPQQLTCTDTHARTQSYTLTRCKHACVRQARTHGNARTYA